MNSPIWNFTVPPGATFLIPQNGTMIEFTIITGSVAFRTGTDKKSGQYNVAAAGFAWKDLDFTKVEVKNLSSTASCAVQCIVGTAGFENRQLILSPSTGQPIVYPTCAAVNSSTQILIRDQSGGSFFDINGGKWIALNRVAIEVFNNDAGTTLVLQNYAGAGAPAAPGAGIIYPLTPIKFEFGGNYRLDLGGAAINAIVNEIYNAIPAT